MTSVSLPARLCVWQLMLVLMTVMTVVMVMLMEMMVVITVIMVVMIMMVIAMMVVVLLVVMVWMTDPWHLGGSCFSWPLEARVNINTCCSSEPPVWLNSTGHSSS